MNPQHPIHAIVKDWRKSRPVKIEVSPAVEKLNRVMFYFDRLTDFQYDHVTDLHAIERYILTRMGHGRTYFRFCEAVEEIYGVKLPV